MTYLETAQRTFDDIRLTHQEAIDEADKLRKEVLDVLKTAPQAVKYPFYEDNILRLF